VNDRSFGSEVIMPGTMGGRAHGREDVSLFL
jgi:hypothetical protein